MKKVCTILDQGLLFLYLFVNCSSTVFLCLFDIYDFRYQGDIDSRFQEMYKGKRAVHEREPCSATNVHDLFISNCLSKIQNSPKFTSLSAPKQLKAIPVILLTHAFCESQASIQYVSAIVNFFGQLPGGWKNSSYSLTVRNENIAHICI